MPGPISHTLFSAIQPPIYTSQDNRRLSGFQPFSLQFKITFLNFVFNSRTLIINVEAQNVQNEKIDFWIQRLGFFKSLCCAIENGI